MTRLQVRRVALSLLALGSLIVLTGFGISPAAHAQPAARVLPAKKYCAAFVTHRHRGGTQAYILSSHCATHPVHPSDSTLLITLYADAEYGGDSYSLYGGSGCDASGYTFGSMPAGWNDRVSSFRVFNNCTYTRLYVDAGPSGGCIQYTGDTPHVGTYINDKASALRLASASHYC